MDENNSPTPEDKQEEGDISRRNFIKAGAGIPAAIIASQINLPANRALVQRSDSALIIRPSDIEFTTEGTISVNSPGLISSYIFNTDSVVEFFSQLGLDPYNVSVDKNGRVVFEDPRAVEVFSNSLLEQGIDPDAFAHKNGVCGLGC